MTPINKFKARVRRDSSMSSIYRGTIVTVLGNHGNLRRVECQDGHTQELHKDELESVEMNPWFRPGDLVVHEDGMQLIITGMNEESEYFRYTVSHRDCMSLEFSADETQLRFDPKNRLFQSLTDTEVRELRAMIADRDRLKNYWNPKRGPGFTDQAVSALEAAQKAVDRHQAADDIKTEADKIEQDMYRENGAKILETLGNLLKQYKSCVSPATEVVTPQGEPVKVQDLRVGDQVMAMDSAGNPMSCRIVGENGAGFADVSNTARTSAAAFKEGLKPDESTGARPAAKEQPVVYAKLMPGDVLKTKVAGNEVRILSATGPGDYPIIGVIQEGSSWVVASWNTQGGYYDQERRGYYIRDLEMPVFSLSPELWARIPPHYRYLTMDITGEWYVATVLPYFDGRLWRFKAGYSDFDRIWDPEILKALERSPDPEQSLLVRPEGGAQ